MQFFPNDVHIVVVNNNIKYPSTYIYVLIIPYTHQLLPSDSFPFQIHLKKKHSNLHLSDSVKYKRRKKKERKKMAGLNADSVTYAEGEFHPRIPLSEPLTTHGVR